MTLLFFTLPCHSSNPLELVKPYIGSCEFYSACNEYLNPEKAYTDYYTQFAKPICDHVVANSQMWDSKLRTWAIETLLCLQERLIPSVEKGHVGKKLAKKSIRLHAKCYIQTGFCDLSEGQQLLFMNSLARENLGPIESKILWQGLRVGLKCRLNLKKFVRAWKNAKQETTPQSTQF